MTAPIQDLRDAIALLQQHDNQYLETDHPVDPNAELAGVYRHIGAGGTVKRPTRIGPAMMFNNIKGYPHSRILVGMHASRQRAALLLGCEASQLALEVGKAVKKPVAPVVVPASSAPCQEQIFLADDPDFDLRTLLPAPTNTPIDAGPFFCLGLALASDPDDASLTDVTIHRLCVQGRDELSMFLAAGRHIEVFRQKAEAAGKPLPITINMGLDPAIYIGACFEAPTTPFGYNELTALSTLAALCPVWLDDFGRGRTSFPLLERFRFDCVKVDKDYFWDKENDPALPGLLQSIHTLTGHVIVEGIETEKQKRLITSAGDIIGQGRYWKEEYIFLCG